jgi:hypothetical protein
VVWRTNQVKPGQKSVPPPSRYPRLVRTLLMSVWFCLRERTSMKSGGRCGVTVMVIEPPCGPRMYGMAFEPGKTKPEIGAAAVTLPEARAHAVGVRVVLLGREPV